LSALKKEDQEVKFWRRRSVKRGEKGRLWRAGVVRCRRKEEDEEKGEEFLTLFFWVLHFYFLPFASL
jgi:hypothetical protein